MLIYYSNYMQYLVWNTMKTLKESSRQQKFTPAHNLKIIGFNCCILLLAINLLKHKTKPDSSLLLQGPMLLPENGDFVGDCFHAPLVMTLETTKLVRFCLFPFLSLQAFLFITKIELVYNYSREDK